MAVLTLPKNPDVRKEIYCHKLILWWDCCRYIFYQEIYRKNLSVKSVAKSLFLSHTLQGCMSRLKLLLNLLH